jgi:hypothetical protein
MKRGARTGWRVESDKGEESFVAKTAKLFSKSQSPLNSPMRAFASSTTQTEPNHSIQDEKRSLLEFDGFSYRLNSPESVSCDFDEFGRDVPRNSVFYQGNLFRVSLLAISASASSVLKYFVVPRAIERICRSKRSFRLKLLPSIEVIAFEFESKLRRIEAFSFSRLASLKSICLPLSVELLSRDSFSHIQLLLSFTFESGARLTELPELSFFDCSSLTSICIPSSVSILHRGSFSHCTLLSSLLFESGSKLHRIGETAFYGCSSFKSVSLPASIEILCKDCFANCPSLSSLTFESGSRLRLIEERALSQCFSLRSICLPASLEMIDGSVFFCSRVSSVTIEEGNCHLRVSGDFLLDVNRLSILRYFGSDSNVNLNFELEPLSSGCSCLFNSRLQRIASKAFSWCSSLQSICIPYSVELLGEHCFEGCGSLSTVTFESGSKLTRIEQYAFSGCSSLRSISLPASLEMIDGSALLLTGISRITIEDGNRHLRISGNLLLDFEGICVIRYFGTDSTVILSRDIEILGPSSFQCCKSLSSLKFESGSKLRRIGAHALRGCASLGSICLPASLEMIDSSILDRRAIAQISIEEGNRHLRVSSNFLLDFDGTALIRYSSTYQMGELDESALSLSSSTLVFGSKLRRIGASALCQCLSLLSLCLPATVEILGEDCFSGCSYLSSLTFESRSQLSRIEARAFYHCSSLESLFIPGLIRELAKDWALMSSLRLVTFESASSLRAMIETDSVDLSGHFDIDIVVCDCELNFPGSSVVIGPGLDHYAYLVKRGSLR